MVFFNFERKPKNEITYYFRMRAAGAVPKREMSGAATGANSIFKTGLLLNSLMFFFNFERKPKHEIAYYFRMRAASAVQKREMSGAATRANSPLKSGLLLDSLMVFSS